jgi:hypothetical protein
MIGTEANFGEFELSRLLEKLMYLLIGGGKFRCTLAEFWPRR